MPTSPRHEDLAALARRHTAVVAYRSAAQHWGWALLFEPTRPQLVVPRNRRVSESARSRLTVSWRALNPSDVVDGWVTSPARTVLDCATALPFGEALAVADSALRSGSVSHRALLALAAHHPARGRARVGRVVRHASAAAANPFESALRAIALGVPGLLPQPQLTIRENGRFLGRVDLGDRALRLAIEADSFAFHGESWMLTRDARRYDDLVAADWLVLRFAWEHVVLRQQWVSTVLSDAVALRRVQLGGRWSTAAAAYRTNRQPTHADRAG
jgi:very-short-patch-repair endonuclease